MYFRIGQCLFCVLIGITCISNVKAEASKTVQAVNHESIASKLLKSYRHRDEFINELLKRMTLEEKLGQLTQLPGSSSETGPAVKPGGDANLEARTVGSYLGIHGANRTRQLQRIAVEESRLGIPVLFAYDVIHGFRTLSPMPLAEAASWDLAQIETSARLAAIEASAHGIHWTFAPMVDISRDPRWGRVVEGAGEDAYLGSRIAAARVRGFQGNNLNASDTIMATAKHFAAYGAAEGGRDYNRADLSERTLRELHLPPFKAAVDAGVASFMSAFNELNGIPAHANRFLLQDVLREQWQFDGLVVSDYLGVRELMVHGVASNAAQAGELALLAGVDVDMVSRIYQRALPDLLRSGKVPLKVLDEAVARVLRMKWALGLFEDPYRYSDLSRQLRRTGTLKHRASVRKLAADSMVLLKNTQQQLPLDQSLETLAVIGPLADDAKAMLGGWSMQGREAQAVSVLAGIKAAVQPETQVLYRKGASVNGQSKAGFAQALDVASDSDAIVLVLGESPEMSSEASNRSTLDLPGVQRELAEALLATEKPLVVVLVSGRPLSVPWLAEHAHSILQAWFPGSEAGHAVADVLFGKVNPSAKLPMSVPYSVGQIPIYYNHTSTGRPGSVTNKYSSRYLDAPLQALYPFGYGLSYTRFRYRQLRLSSDSITPTETLKISLMVENSGDREGDEVVQLYIRDEFASVIRPVRELKGFKRIALDPGETREVHFELQVEDLAFLDQQHKQVAEAGDFTVFVSSSSVGGLEARFTLETSWSARQP